MKRELTSDEVIAWNLQMMKTGMVKHLSSESIGGNAATITIEGKRYSCAAANMYVDKTTGKILIFGNIQDIDESIKDNSANVECGLHVACNFDRRYREIFCGIFFYVNTLYEWNEGLLSETAKSNIQQAIEKYNTEVAEEITRRN